MQKLILLDIGCAGGVHHNWYKLPINNINIIGVDANVAEIARLKTIEPRNTWIAAQVGKAKTIEQLNSISSYDEFLSKKFTEKVVSLDSICKNPDFIKIDVDGHEIDILESGHEALSHASGIYLESEFEIPSYNPRNNLFNQGDILRSYGFHLEFMWGQRYSTKYSNPNDTSCRSRCVGNGLWLKESHKLKNFWKKLYEVPTTWLGEE